MTSCKYEMAILVDNVSDSAFEFYLIWLICHNETITSGKIRFPPWERNTSGPPAGPPRTQC